MVIRHKRVSNLKRAVSNNQIQQELPHEKLSQSIVGSRETGNLIRGAVEFLLEMTATFDLFTDLQVAV